MSPEQSSDHETEQDMRLLVTGASGKTGHEVVRQAIAAGHEVTALVRDPTRLTIRGQHLTVFEGDVLNTHDLESALAGQDAVISTLGAGAKNALTSPLGNRPRVGVMEGSTAALIEAAGAVGVRRVVMMSTFMLAPNFRAGIMKPLALYYKGMNDDKRTAEEALRRSQLDWTIVWATKLTDGERSGCERLVPVTEIVTPRNSVSRSDAAAFLLAQLEDDSTIRKAIVCTAE
jgi:putative NADH-flavin reductase